jgi:hypothetical protein
MGARLARPRCAVKPQRLYGRARAWRARGLDGKCARRAIICIAHDGDLHDHEPGAARTGRQLEVTVFGSTW